MARGACNRSLTIESDDDTKKLSITGKGLTTDHLKFVSKNESKYNSSSEILE